MPSKLFGITYPKKGDKKKWKGKNYVAVSTSGSHDVALKEAIRHGSSSIMTSKKVGDVHFYTAWAFVPER